MQRVDRTQHVSEAERHDTQRVLAVVSDTLGQAYAKQGREHSAPEEWFDSELQIRCTARQADGGLEVELVVRYLRLDCGGSVRGP